MHFEKIKLSGLVGGWQLTSLLVLSLHLLMELPIITSTGYFSFHMGLLKSLVGPSRDSKMAVSGFEMYIGQRFPDMVSLRMSERKGSVGDY